MKHIWCLPVQINWRFLREQSMYTHRDTHTRRQPNNLICKVSKELTKTRVLKLNNDLMLSFAKTWMFLTHYKSVQICIRRRYILELWTKCYVVRTVKWWIYFKKREKKFRVHQCLVCSRHLSRSLIKCVLLHVMLPQLHIGNRNHSI